MATLTTLVDGTIPVAADFNDNFAALNTEARPATTGGTGFSTFAAADMLYASSTTALAKLAIGDPFRVLTVSTSNLPSWATLQTMDFTGFEMSNAADTDHDITIGIGSGWSSNAASTDRHFIRLAGALTKRIDAAWAVGTGQGGLDTGAVGNSSWYHLWVIRTDSGTTDVLFSLSATAPTMPSNYTKKRRIGSVLTDGSANILQFTQVGDHFLWNDPPLDLDASAVTTARTTATLSVPTGFKMLATINVMMTNASATELYVSSSATDEAPSTSAAPLAQFRCTAGGTEVGQITTMTSTTSTVFVRAGAASTTVRIATLGWQDRRGRDD